MQCLTLLLLYPVYTTTEDTKGAKKNKTCRIRVRALARLFALRVLYAFRGEQKHFARRLSRRVQDQIVRLSCLLRYWPVEVSVTMARGSALRPFHHDIASDDSHDRPAGDIPAFIDGPGRHRVKKFLGDLCTPLQIDDHKIRIGARQDRAFFWIKAEDARGIFTGDLGQALDRDSILYLRPR